MTTDPRQTELIDGDRRATPRRRTASLTVAVGRGKPAHRGGRTGEGAR
ncbi:DUF6380 family protein [Streptomyces mexicanus]